MFSTTDTIVAIATPPGRGGIGVVRLSGSAACAIAGRLTSRGGRPLLPRRATLTKFRFDGLAAIDEVVATWFPAPHSYTGEDVVELSGHGSPVVLNRVVGAALEHGARAAAPGEFTLRAFLNGRIDLTQAEAVADLIDAVTPLQARVAFDQLQGTLTQEIGGIDSMLFEVIARLEASVDFPDEGYHFVEPSALAEELDRIAATIERLLHDAGRGRLVREGLQVAIVGKPNVGKSSLFNALVGAARAIVTDVPGTTRDLITEVVDLDGLPVTFVDTAGVRETEDIIEAQGVGRTRQAVTSADLVLVVLDGSRSLDELDREILSITVDCKRVIALGKSDIAVARHDEEPGAVPVSAITGFGLECLRQRIAEALDVELHRERPGITNLRHIALVRLAGDGIRRAREALTATGGALSEEFVLADLQDARTALEEVTGRRIPEAVLEHIFERFCIGK